MTIADLKPGQSARIASVDTSLPDVVRLMILGLVEGADVRFQHAAIGGDPLEVNVFGTSISIRREQARRFQVSGAGAGG
jgi:ferrous iron transport protein A